MTDYPYDFQLADALPGQPDKERTALTKLIEFITDTDGTPLQGYNDIYDKATELLELERKQIVEARADGIKEIMDGELMSSNDYFQNKYQQP